jgi:hypothetical protein
MSLRYDTLIDATLERFPDYEETSYYAENDKESAYPFFYGFTQYVVALADADNSPEPSDELRDIFSFFNEMIESEDETVATLFVVEIMESLMREDSTRKLCKALLGAMGQHYYAQVAKVMGIKEKE